MAYIGRPSIVGNFVKLDAISVVNGQAAYTMQNSSANFTDYSSVNQFMVSLNGTIQSPGSSFTVSGSTITFSSNLVTNDVIDFIIVFGNSLSSGVPTDATVTTAKLSGALVTPSTLDVNGNELILDADAATSITADTDDRIDIKVAGTDRIQFNSDGGIKSLTAAPIINFDFSTSVTLADGAGIDFDNTSGTWLVTEQSQTGASAIMVAGGGSTAIVGQNGSSYNNAESGTFRFFRVSGQAKYRFENQQGNSCNFGFCHISTRAST